MPVASEQLTAQLHLLTLAAIICQPLLNVKALEVTEETGVRDRRGVFSAWPLCVRTAAVFTRLTNTGKCQPVPYLASGEGLLRFAASWGLKTYSKRRHASN